MHPITMAEDGLIDILVTPEIIVIEAGNVGTDPSGKLEVANNAPKILSRYLRASPSSCHDFCKFGLKHAVEAKAKSPTTKRTTAIHGEGQYLEKTRSFLERKNKLITCPKPSPDSKTQISDKSFIIKREVPTLARKIGIRKKDFSSPGKGVDVSARRTSDSKLMPTKPPSPTTQGNRNSDRSKYPLGGSSVHRSGEIGIGKEMRTSKTGEDENLVPRTASLPPKPPVKRVASINAVKSNNLKGMSHVRNQNNARKAKPEQGSDEKVVEKTLYSVEPEAGNKTVEPTQNGTHSTQLSRSSSLSSEGKSLRCARNKSQTTQSSPVSENKNLRRTRNGIRTTPSPPSSENKSSRRTRNGIRTTPSPTSSENKSSRRTRNGSRSSQSPPSSHSSSMFQSESTCSRDSSSISEHDGIGTEKKSANRKVGQKNRPRRGGITSSEDKDRQHPSTSFRRGKTVDLQPENNGARRLKFKQSRALGENQNSKGDTKRRNYRKRGGGGGGKLNGNNSASEKITLRHQEVQGRKNTQSLLNNVIEATASKLVESRKGKVKALVGAFETVISLHDAKPSAVATTC